MNAMQSVLNKFESIKIDPSWSFADKTRKDTAYITHGYHRYPAKFIPQIVSRLAEQYTKKGDLIVDPFGGCGTTLIESKVLSRRSVGVDINPVAVLITQAKTTSLEPTIVEEQFLILKEKINDFKENTKSKAPKHERIDYWFKPIEKEKLAFLFGEISKIKDKDVKNFFYCGFSNILKNCSVWMQKSNKPIRDKEKKPADPFVIFARQMKAMMRGNDSFTNILRDKECLETPCTVHKSDARKIPLEDNSVNLVVTSPPYVTSYEYADLHQLTTLWFEYTESLSDFRKQFIGTAYHSKKEIYLNSKIAESISNELLEKDKKIANEVATYFSEMAQVFEEMKRILKPGGIISIVIGNTSLRGVEILNAEVFTEQLQGIGFKVNNIIKREIPSKNLPSTRDKNTGRFVKASDKGKVLAYPTEYIVIMKKT